MGNFFDRLTGQERRERVASAPTGGQRGFCVRTCDGSYFPMQSRPGLSAAEACSSFCPASPTQVFSGSTIDHAVARDGTRYADLPNAFVYRTKLIGGCTCNGKAAGGLASLDARTDPTLRPGDVVATNEGLMAFTAGRNKVANFTPVDQARFNKAERDKLAQMKVTPVEEDATGGIPAAWTDRADPGLRRTSSR